MMCATPNRPAHIVALPGEQGRASDGSMRCPSAPLDTDTIQIVQVQKAIQNRHAGISVRQGYGGSTNRDYSLERFRTRERYAFYVA